MLLLSWQVNMASVSVGCTRQRPSDPLVLHILLAFDECYLVSVLIENPRTQLKLEGHKVRIAIFIHIRGISLCMCPRNCADFRTPMCRHSITIEPVHQADCLFMTSKIYEEVPTVCPGKSVNRTIEEIKPITHLCNMCNQTVLGVSIGNVTHHNCCLIAIQMREWQVGLFHFC